MLVQAELMVTWHVIYYWLIIIVNLTLTGADLVGQRSVYSLFLLTNFWKPNKAMLWAALISLFQLVWQLGQEAYRLGDLDIFSLNIEPFCLHLEQILVELYSSISNKFTLRFNSKHFLISLPGGLMYPLIGLFALIWAFPRNTLIFFVLPFPTNSSLIILFNV